MQQQYDHAQAWPRVQAILRTSLGSETFDAWLGSLHADSLTNSSGPRGDQYTAHMSVPTLFLKNWVARHYQDALVASWNAAQVPVAAVEISVRTPVLRRPTTVPASAPVPKEPQDIVPQLRTAATAPVSALHATLGGSPLDPRLTFGTFVAGRSNALAHAAARQVAESRRGDPVMCTPLYIHADAGLGKTHLLQAIAWAGNSGGEHHVVYLTAEKLVHGFMQALKTQTAFAFREALRGIDVLVIDDLQYLQGKSSRNEFGHTLNAFMDAGRHVVVGADRPPNDLEMFDDRVHSRLMGGLVVEVGPPAEELRLGILKSRVAAVQVHAPGFDIPEPVLAYIARTVVRSGRELEGATNRLAAHWNLTHEPVTLDIAERQIRDLVRPHEPKRVRIEDVQRVVARQYNVSRNDLLSSRRTANVVRPRQVAMYLAKTLTLRSLPEIGRRFGGRDHTTVLHAVSKIAWAIGERTDKVPSSVRYPCGPVDKQLADEIEMLKKQLQE